MKRSQLSALPDEVIQNVLCYLTYNNTLALEGTCRRFRDVANEPLLWKSYCRETWKKWDSKHDIKSKLVNGEFTGWKQLFAERTHTRNKIRDIMNSVIYSGTDRIERFESITRLGYDAKDTLTEGFRLAHLHPGDVLARRYWNHVALGNLHRAQAIDLWNTLRYRAQDEEPFEKSLGALDLFVLTASREGDVEDIYVKLDSYVDILRQEHPEMGDMSARQIASLVARFLTQKGWTGIDDGRDYHNVEHNFLGVALYGARHNSLPLVSVIIYCYVLRKLGLQAAPCGFPMHVYALVRPPRGQDLDGNVQDQDMATASIYMDPFRSDQEVPISSLAEQLRLLGIRSTSLDHDNFLGESSAREITTRSARNILNSQRSRQSPLEDVDKDAATYGAAWALALFPSNPAQLQQALRMVWQEFGEEFIYDVGLIQAHILPLMVNLPEYNQYVQACLQLRRFDAKVKTERRRTEQNATVKHKVGDVFHHRRYNYIGAITGWDHKCLSGEAWIQQMGVDRLPNGRDQPFYHVLCVDGSTRYVAEENIEIQRIDKDIADSFPMETGRYFLRWDDENKVFVNNMKGEFPEG